MRMYVANVSDQRVEFHYSLPEQVKRRTIVIQPRSQEKIPEEALQTEDVDAIVEQHTMYGFVKDDEVGSVSQRKKFSGLCYAVDRPVSMIRMEALYRGNMGVLVTRGEEIRKETAIVANDQMTATVKRETRGMENPPETRNFSTFVQEQESKDGYSPNPVNEVLQVDRSLPAAVAGRRGRR